MPSNLANNALSRRDCLRWGGLLASTGFLPHEWQAASMAAELQPPRSGARPARACILVYLLGGPPQLDMFDLKPNAPKEVRGPFQPIATKTPGLHICEHLPKLAARTDRYALLRAVSHPNANHTPMIHYTLTGRHVDQPQVDNDTSPPRRTDFPNFGTILHKLRGTPEGLPGSMAIPECAVRSNEGNVRAAVPLRGGRAGFLGAAYDPFLLNGDPRSPKSLPEVMLPQEVSQLRFEQRMALLSTFDAKSPESLATRGFDVLKQTAVRMTGSPDNDGLYSLDREPEPLREKYGKHRFGQSLMLARRCVEAGIPSVNIYFNHMTRCDGWDTHGKNFEGCKEELLPLVDQGLSALLDDLSDRGMLDDVVVACYGEFGRTPKINGNAGRDHWGNCSTTFLAGGGIRGGAIHGESDALAAFPKSGTVDPVDVHATIYHCLGYHRDVQIYDNLSRPHAITTGHVIQAVL